MTQSQNIEDAFNSMLRTDYIPLADTEKLKLLADYYVDYMGYMKDIVGPTDQLIVGRRGTGKTTLLYRALVECMRSWGPGETSARPRTLGVYLDLEKCQSLSSTATSDYETFEFAFVAELCDAIKEELLRSWPSLAKEPTLIDRIFRNGETKKAVAVNTELARLVSVLTSGLPRFVNKSGPVEKRSELKQSYTDKTDFSASLGATEAKLTGSVGADDNFSTLSETKQSENIHYRLSVADILRVIGDLRKAANIPYFLIFIDEFSSLHTDLQQRFTTLLKKMLGNHAGVYIKLGAITDNYQLGSSIILQRDLFELSLDLDAFVGRSGSLTAAMDQLTQLTEMIIEQRIQAYTQSPGSRIFDAPEDAYRELTRSAMGVPRTIGIVLKQAWSRARQSSRGRIRRTDLDYGIRYASNAYMNQMTGAARNGVAIPEHVPEVWDSILNRAALERRKVPDSPASHFMVLPKNEERLRFLNMFFLVHLLEKGRTTKKERVNRSLYSFDYGIALENNLGWGDDKNVIRQQRFAYDSTLQEYDRFYDAGQMASFRCTQCKKIYTEAELMLNGSRLQFCPDDRADIEVVVERRNDTTYTEEEIKIIGAIRSARRADRLAARQVADDVGCYVQKVAKFGEKLERERLIARERPDDANRHYYFDVERE